MRAHLGASQARAAQVLAELGPSVVDVGVASGMWGDVPTYEDLEEYVRVASKAGKKPAAFVNACGQHWGQPLNGHLSDGTPVINSVCFGPANDTSGGHYLWCEA